MRFFRFCLLLATFTSLLALSSCTNRYRLESVVDKEIGRAQLLAKTRLELDKFLGRSDSRLKSSILSHVSRHIKINYDTIIDGKRARVNVRAVVPKMDELGTLMLLASFMPKDEMLNMNLQSLLTEVAKNSRRPASLESMKIEVYEFSVDFERVRYDWVVNSDHLKRAYSKKHITGRQ